MAFTEFTAPIQYEYKPLNLSAFMVPLAKMQEQYDTVESAIAGSTVDVSSLDWGTDKERAKELKNTYGQKINELSKNLAESKNYKQAAIKLKELQNTWIKDPERVALESNYKLVQDLVKEQKERIGKSMANNGITQGQYDQWYRKMKEDYEGLSGADFKASYDDPEGKYNIVGNTARLADMTEELEKVKFEVAKAVPGQTVEGVMQAIGYDTETMDKRFLQTTISEKNKDEIARKVEGYVSQLPRFKPWLAEVAAYDYRDIKRDPEQFQRTASELNTKYINSLNQQIQGLEKGAKKNPALLQTQDYKDLLEDRDAAIKAQKSGEYDPNVIGSLYKTNFEQQMYDADALGRLLAYKNVERNYDWRKLHIDDGGGSGDGASAGAQDGYMIPGSEEVTFTNLNGQKVDSGKNLYASVGKVNNLAGGAVRNVIMGTKGSPLNLQLQKDPGQIYARQNSLLEAITKTISAGGDAKMLKRLANQKGIHIPDAEAGNIWRTFNKPGNQAISDFKREVEASRPQALRYEEAQTMMDGMEKSVIADKDFQKTMYEAGLQTYSAGRSAQNPIAESYFIPSKYSDSDYKKAGIKKPSGNSLYSLTFNDVAKLNGFKNFQDAASKGFTFGGAKMKNDGILGGAVSAGGYYNQKVGEFSNKLGNKAEMGYRYVNNKSVDKQLTKYFLGTDELTSYRPAFGKSWSNVPGFTEEGRLAPGTKLNISENRAPKLVVQGNKLLYEIPISYKDEEGQSKEGTVLVEPKEGMQTRHSQILTDARSSVSARETEADKETYDMLNVAQFNNIYQGNNLSNQVIKSAQVVKNGAPAKLYSIPFDGKTNLQVEKVNVGGTNPVLKIAQIDVNTGQRLGYLNNPGTNKAWYIDADSNEAAAAVKSALIQATGQ
jgi:transposase-like protein